MEVESPLVDGSDGTRLPLPERIPCSAAQSAEYTYLDWVKVVVINKQE